ncbi:Fe-S cluster assembly protein SufD [Ornithobacterium rhinotracheale]|uniref:Fe-S cluster assembly protein SufD n=1 Tax=Ornithobacterium rhinotracheale TaxID=28251 RepID=UPI00129C43D8|nr:Fe-S cluster assembly protein SufD [Ornithobacterium rhinotracheale]MRI63050.1 Fe-S cluster assembly protein SufD [Ornithobacterium rhinotracheale]
MSKFLEEIKSHFESYPTPSERQTQAFEEFVQEGFPTTKNEEWRFTNLKPVISQEYNLKLNEEALNLRDVEQYFIPELDSYKIVFVNGFFAENLSNIGSEIEFLPVAAAKENAIYQKYLNTVVKHENSLESLNTALATNGYYIHIKHNQKVEKPIEIVFFTNEAQASFIQPKNLIVAGDHAELNVIESHVSLNQEPHFTNAVTEIVVGENTQINFYKTQNDTEHTALIDQVFAEQKQGSAVSIDTLSLGGKFTRNGLNFKQLGENCNSLMQAVSLGEGEQLIDHHTLVEHTAANCESHELYRTILDGKSKGVFNGKIIVDPEAQKIDAFQQNNNILLTDDASINTKPQLEIFADDVKCSHGCTVGQIDKDALFYMQQRGIPTKEAQAFLLYAFSADVLSSIEIEPLKIYWTKLLASKLKVELDF